MHRSAFLKGALFVGAYFVLAHVGIPLREGNINASPFWLPTGLSLAAIILFGYRFWPAIVMAVAVRAIAGGFAVPLSLALGAVKAGQVLVGAWALRGSGRFNGALDNVRVVLALILGGALVASGLGALSSAFLFALSGVVTWSRYLELVGTWWLGDAMGVLIVVPTVLAFAMPGQRAFRGASALSIAVTVLLLFAACEVAFGRLLSPADLPLAYLPLPVIFWAALRFGVQGAALSSCGASLYATIGTVSGYGPFARSSPLESLLLLETFLAIIIVTALVLGSVIEERRKAARALLHAQRRYSLASRAGSAGVWEWALDSGNIYVDPVFASILGYERDELGILVAAWAGRVHPEDAERARAELADHLEGKTPRYEVELRLRHKDGSFRWFLTRGEAQRDAQDKTVRMVGTAVDITPRKRSERLLAGSNRVLELVAEGESLGVVLKVLAENVEAQTECLCLIRRMSEDGRTLRLLAAPERFGDPSGGASSTTTETLASVPVGYEGGTCGQAAQEKERVITTDVAADPSWSGLRRQAEALGLRSCLSVPILSGTNEVLGTVALCCDRPRTPTRADIDVADNAAQLARVALEHARARDAVEKSERSLRESRERVRHLAARLIAAQEEERRRVSRELHDGLNQQLAALSLEIGKLRAQVASDETTRERLSELQERASRLIDDARRMSHELHPSVLEHLGLVAAARAYCDEMNGRGDIEVRFDPSRAPERVGTETALCLFRIVQEGVRNASKHSGARFVVVTLETTSGHIELTIRDDGCGFDPEGVTGRGLGLVSMTERVRALGGELDILSQPGDGTTLRVRLPARPRDDVGEAAVRGIAT